MWVLALRLTVGVLAMIGFGTLLGFAVVGCIAWAQSEAEEAETDDLI